MLKKQNLLTIFAIVVCTIANYYVGISLGKRFIVSSGNSGGEWCQPLPELSSFNSLEEVHRFQTTLRIEKPPCYARYLPKFEKYINRLNILYGPHNQSGKRKTSIDWPPPAGELNVSIPEYRNTNPSQRLLQSEMYKMDGLRIYLTMACTQAQASGLGNSILRIFTSRLLAVATNSTFSFHCHENDMNLTERCRHSDGNLCLLGHLEIDTKYPESPDMLFPQKLPNNISALLSACDGKYPHKLPNCLGIFSNPIIRDIQRIAQNAMVTHNIQPDDVVIHLRCGDIFQFKGGVGGKGTENGSGYGFLPHDFYIDRMMNFANDIRTISIVTQPTDKKYMRYQDVSHGKKCHAIVYDLQQYLKKRFPLAEVYIRNNPHEGETTFTSFVRLVLAKKASFCGPSTFCTSAVLSTFAEKGYIL